MDYQVISYVSNKYGNKLHLLSVQWIPYPERQTSIQRFFNIKPKQKPPFIVDYVGDKRSWHRLPNKIKCTLSMNSKLHDIQEEHLKTISNE